MALLATTTTLNSLPPSREQLLALLSNNPKSIVTLLGLTLTHIAYYSAR